MLIMSQNRKSLLNLESAGEIFLSSAYGDYHEGEPVKVLASFPLAEDVTVNLGEYKSEARAMDVLDVIAQSYARHTLPQGGLAFVPPKVYQMPEN